MNLMRKLKKISTNKNILKTSTVKTCYCKERLSIQLIITTNRLRQNSQVINEIHIPSILKSLVKALITPNHLINLINTPYLMDIIQQIFQVSQILQANSCPQQLNYAYNILSRKQRQPNLSLSFHPRTLTIRIKWLCKTVSVDLTQCLKILVRIFLQLSMCSTDLNTVLKTD